MSKTEANQPPASARPDPDQEFELDESAPDAGAQTGHEAFGGNELAELNRQLDEARSKAEEHWNTVLRVNAEMDNVRKRAQRDVENAHKFALERFAGELLPVKDSLEMGLAAASGGQPEVAKLREGSELILKMLGDALEKFGIREINPIGEAFNPDQHQAISMQESRDKTPNTVLFVMQKGYLLNDRLLRPAMVVVAKPASGAEENQRPGGHFNDKA
jgi:molecular chaperone GrpE